MKVPGKDKLYHGTKIQACTSKNITPKQTTLHLFYTFLFLSNLVFKFSIVLIGIFFWIIFTTIYLLFCLLINISYFIDLEVYPVPLRLFIRSSQNLMRLSVFFEDFQFQNVLTYVLIFHKNCLLVNGENYSRCL